MKVFRTVFLVDINCYCWYLLFTYREGGGPGNTWEKGLVITNYIHDFELAQKTCVMKVEKRATGKVNVVVKGPVGEFSNSEKIGKGKY